MDLYCHANSTFSRRVRIALLEKGLDANEIQTTRPERASAGYLALNPYGRIPTLVDGNVVLYESSAILEYLEGRFPAPSLVPDDPAGRARVAMLVKLCDLDYTPHAVRIQRPMRLDPEDTWDRADMARARDACARHYAILGRQLAESEYLVGGRFTWADLAYLPFLHFHDLIDVELPPNLAAWRERLAARPSARATEPTA